MQTTYWSACSITPSSSVCHVFFTGKFRKKSPTDLYSASKDSNMHYVLDCRPLSTSRSVCHFCKEIVEKTQPSSTGIIRKTCTGHMCLTALTLIAAFIRTSEHSVPCLHHTVRDRPTGRPRPCFRECPPASRRNLRLGPRKLRVKRGGAAQDVAVAVPQLSCNLKCWQRGYCVGQIM